MLLNLPIEVILSIASHLSFHNKLNLIKTCRKLKGILVERSLYEQLIILDSKSRTTKIINRFQTNQLNGSQVKKLHLDASNLNDDLFSKLPTIFPNITHFSSLAVSYDTERPEEVANQLLLWKDTLERFDTGDQSFEFQRLLQTNTFSRLVSLSFTPFFINGEHSYNKGIHIIECLKHTPSLKDLVLHHCEITINLLERLHSNCPQLNSLCLKGLIIQTNGEHLPIVVIPATQLVSFRIDCDVLICDRAGYFLDYIIIKYTRLLRLEFLSNAKEWELDYLLGKIYIHEIGDDEEVDDDTLFEDQRDDFGYTQLNYQCEGDRFLSNLPSTLKVLKLDTTYFENIMYALDRSNIDPTSLEFYQNDKESFHVFNGAEELAYLKKWNSLKYLRVTVDSAMQAYNLKSTSTSVTKLNVTVKGDVACNMVDFGWFLVVFPSVVELEVHFAGMVEVGLNVDLQQPYPSLEILTIESGSLSPILKDVIHTIAPNLKSFTIKQY